MRTVSRPTLSGIPEPRPNLLLRTALREAVRGGVLRQFLFPPRALGAAPDRVSPSRRRLVLVPAFRCAPNSFPSAPQAKAFACAAALLIRESKGKGCPRLARSVLSLTEFMICKIAQRCFV